MAIFLTIFGIISIVGGIIFLFFPAGGIGVVLGLGGIALGLVDIGLAVMFAG
jgi:hypothetical protein